MDAHMLNFQEMKDFLIKNSQFTKPVVAVAAADDKVVLEAIKEMNAHGVSIVRIRRNDDGRWSAMPDAADIPPISWRS